MPARTQPRVPHKERLIRSGFRLLYAQGFHGTTVDAVLADAGVPKGSFYHHFRSKQAFGMAVLDRYDAAQASALGRWAEREDLAVPERLSGYHNEFVEQFIGSDWQRACLVGKLSNELSVSSEAYRERLASSFAKWRGAIAALLKEGQRRGEVRTDETSERIADAVLAMIQGGFVAALAIRDRDYLRAVGVSLQDLVEAPK